MEQFLWARESWWTGEPPTYIVAMVKNSLRNEMHGCPSKAPAIMEPMDINTSCSSKMVCPSVVY